MWRTIVTIVAVAAAGCSAAPAATPIIIYVTPSPGLPTAAPTQSPVIIYVTPSPGAATPVPTEPATAPATQIPTAPPTPRPTATPVPTINPSDYKAFDRREWSELLKDPWEHAFESRIVWACISQFDSATGPDAFRGQASYRNENYWYSNGENAYFEINPITYAGLLDDFFEDDVVRMYVITATDYSYETTSGGTLTVPLFSITGIERKGSC